MTKIIDMLTRKEILEHRYSKEVAKELIGYIMAYNQEAGYEANKLIIEVCAMIENNSGITPEDYRKANV